MLDEIVGIGISATEEKLHGEKKEEKQTFGGALLRFIVSIVWFVVAVGASLLGAMAMVGDFFSNLMGEGRGLAVLALLLSGGVALITFIVPYLRKKGSMTRWFGIVCLGDFIWWCYLLMTGWGSF